MSEANLVRGVIQAARGWIGTPYVHQASFRGVGCDCLGLLRGVWREVRGAEPFLPPPYAPDWAESTGCEALAEAAARLFDPINLAAFEAGDVLLFRWRDDCPAKHCAIATSATTMVHAHDGACVAEVTIGRGWRRRIAFAFRFRTKD